jgi:hypothetical protein
MNLPFTLNLLVATYFLHSYLITEVWDVFECFFYRNLRTFMYLSFISSGALKSASEHVFLTVVSSSTVFGSHVPSLHEDIDFSAVDSSTLILIFSILGSFLIPIELGFSVRGLGKLTSFLGNICCTVSYFLRRFYDYGN